MDSDEAIDHSKDVTIKMIRAELKEHREMYKETERILDKTAKLQAENAVRIKEIGRRMKETERIMKENAVRMKETDRQMKETDRQMKETDQQIKEFNKRFGDFTNRFGEMVEHMVAPGLQKKFTELNLVFLQANKETKIADRKNNIFLEIDILLENGDTALLVETKTKPNMEDVKDHVKRMEKMRKYADLHGDTRKFLGAIAGVALTDRVKAFILKNGFYAAVPSGETFDIVSPEGNAREW